MDTAIQTTRLIPDVTPKKKPGSEVGPAEAALRLQKRFRRVARKLVLHDRHLRQDVVQEMSLAVLQCKEPHMLAWFQQLGYWRALDYLRRVSERPAQWIEKAARVKLKLLRDREFTRIHYLTLVEG